MAKISLWGRKPLVGANGSRNIPRAPSRSASQMRPIGNGAASVTGLHRDAGKEKRIASRSRGARKLKNGLYWLKFSGTDTVARSSAKKRMKSRVAKPGAGTCGEVLAMVRKFPAVLVGTSSAPAFIPNIAIESETNAR